MNMAFISILKEISTASALEKEMAMNHNNTNNTVKSNMDSSSNDHKIILRTSEGVHIVMIKDIIRCSSDDNYTTFHINDNNRVCVSTTLTEYAELLENFNFIQTHQSHLINLDYAAQFVNSDGGQIIMQNGDSILVSRRRKKQLLDTLMELYN